MRFAFTLATLIGFVAVSASAAAEDGYLLLQDHDRLAERDGAEPAQLFVYDADGEIVHSGAGGGQFEAGHYVPVAPGWYFVEVGRYRNASNAWKMYVESQHVTVVPSGWVSVRAVPLNEQVSTTCSQWNAELNSFVEGADGVDVVTMTNRGSGVREWGAMQLMAGEHRVFFNGVPTMVSVVPDTLTPMPTGFQDPVYGNRPTLSMGPEEDASALRVPLCDVSPRQVPAGQYWASAAVPTETYPYERRVWTRVEVTPDEVDETLSLRTPRLEHERFEGEGSTPVALTEEERQLLQADEGGGVRLRGFGR